MSNITFNFKGKVVLITGSSSGIGAATAMMYAKAGADVVITGRNAERLLAVAEKCRQISPNESKPLQVLADVTKQEDLKRLVESAINEFGKLDILVNNAGGPGSRHCILLTDHDYMNDYNFVMKTNIDSVVYLTHLCVEYLAKTEGNIVNISSMAGIRGGSNSSAYCMSKSALNMFTICMAAELGVKSIRVNSVVVGPVKTGILDQYNMCNVDAIFDSMGKLLPVGRCGQPEDIGNAILYLSSKEASFVTGTNMSVDGGYKAANVHIDQNFFNKL